MGRDPCTSCTHGVARGQGLRHKSIQHPNFIDVITSRSIEPASQLLTDLGEELCFPGCSQLVEGSVSSPEPGLTQHGEGSPDARSPDTMCVGGVWVGEGFPGPHIWEMPCFRHYLPGLPGDHWHVNGSESSIWFCFIWSFSNLFDHR